MEKIYEVEGMTCVICKANVEKALNKCIGVNKANVNLLENEVFVDFDENKISELDLKKAVDKAGYKLLLSKEKKTDKEKIKLVLSIISCILLMYFSMYSKNDTSIIQLFLCLFVLIINKHFFISGFKALFSLSPNMDSLVSLSSAVSFIYSLFALYKIKNGDNFYNLYFETSAMVLTIVAFGKYIEKNTKAKTGKIIRA